MTRRDNEEHRAAVARFGVQGVPTIVFLDASGGEPPDTRVVGFMPPNEFLKRMPPKHFALNENTGQQSAKPEPR